MGMFRPRGPQYVELETSEVGLRASQPPWSLWADSFGRLATRALQILLVVAITVGAVWVLQQVTLVTIPLMLALIFGSAFAPVMAWMHRRGVPSVLATVITLLTILVILGAVGWLIVWAVSGQWEDLAVQAQEGFQSVIAWINTLPFAPSDNQLHEWGAQATEFLTSAQFGSGALAGVNAIANFLTGLVLMVTILFFFLKDGPQMWEFVLRPFRGEKYLRARRIGSKTVGILGSYVRGTAFVALVDSIGILIGLLILQVPLAIPLAALVFLLAFIPIVGAVLAGIVAALVALVANGWVNALFVVGVVVLVNQLEGNFLQPVLMGRSMRLHSFVVLIALAVGTAVNGILGAVLAVPIAAVVWGVIQVWDGPDRPARWARPKRALES
ncbi:AI-2E family transporter [Microbacterium sp. 4R-513]|uniref:AI-2E family transporter n=1 Tax=Microbacterium sp. 4R-513 TaxID=2567934 RepID=UPI0013E1E8BE|nr:AI-2E family transporter [Microbacterium sp. 4R-513]QIG38472.1 AI-2E family transporter [Microbacterium sp. 4R-513]